MTILVKLVGEESSPLKLSVTTEAVLPFTTLRDGARQIVQSIPEACISRKVTLMANTGAGILLRLAPVIWPAMGANMLLF